jgi:hypothetical protein
MLNSIVNILTLMIVLYNLTFPMSIKLYLKEYENTYREIVKFKIYLIILNTFPFIPFLKSNLINSGSS